MIVDIQCKAIIQYGIKLRQIEIRIRQIDTGTDIGCRITILRIKSLYQIMRRSVRAKAVKFAAELAGLKFLDAVWLMLMFLGALVLIPMFIPASHLVWESKDLLCLNMQLMI